MNKKATIVDDKILINLRKVQIEILTEIDRLCQKNNINFFLTGGTLLGAVRHKGFIPWDDDLDIAMTREDFEKFRSIVKNQLNEKYFFDYYDTDDNYYLPFAKVRKNNTTFDEQASKKIDNHKGIFVDIFIYETVDNNISRCFIKAALIQILSDTVLLKKKLIKINSCRHPIFSLVFCAFSSKFILKFIDFISKRFNGKSENKKNVVCFNSLLNIRKEFFSLEDFFPLKKIPFENNKYNGLNNNDKFLTVQYGDYMKLPPIEERVNHNTLDISFTIGKQMNNKQE